MNETNIENVITKFQKDKKTIIKKIIITSNAILNEGINTLFIKVSTTRIRFRYSAFLSFFDVFEFKIFLNIFKIIVFLNLCEKLIKS